VVGGSPDRGSEHLVAGRYEYKVAELREGMVGGKMSGSKLEKVLNEHAGEGWQLKAITAVEVKGRIGPGGVEGVLVTFERPLS
jgi:predicted ABC-type sugar transport system permease subunit